MAKFLFVYREPIANIPTAPPSPEVMQQILATWNAWIDRFRQSGQIVDPGDGLQPGGKVLAANGVVTDGPFVEAKEVLGGYSIIQADSLEHALTVARECPATQGGMSIEIRELAGW